jgi:hypothetical protein
MQPYPEWLHMLAWAWLALSFLSGLIIIADELRRPQKMAIMNLVWPITALYGGPVALWGYLKAGRMTLHGHPHHGEHGGGQHQPGGGSRTQIALAVTHCGAGCTLGDIAAEYWVAAMGLAFAGGAFPTRLVMDFLLAWLFGVIFQYFTIAPMRGLAPLEGIMAAIRADTFAIAAFEIGLFGWMALSHYVIFPGPHLNPGEAPFWFMMQIGMIIGFFTSYPANAALLKMGWKEKMG